MPVSQKKLFLFPAIEEPLPWCIQSQSPKKNMHRCNKHTLYVPYIHTTHQSPMGEYAFYTISSIKLSQSTQFSAHNESILKVNFEFLERLFLCMCFCVYGRKKAIPRMTTEESYFLLIVRIMNQHNTLLLPMCCTAWEEVLPKTDSTSNIHKLMNERVYGYIHCFQCTHLILQKHACFWNQTKIVDSMWKLQNHKIFNIFVSLAEFQQYYLRTPIYIITTTAAANTNIMQFT